MDRECPARCHTPVARLAESLFWRVRVQADVRLPVRIANAEILAKARATNVQQRLSHPVRVRACFGEAVAAGSRFRPLVAGFAQALGRDAPQQQIHDSGTPPGLLVTHRTAVVLRVSRAGQATHQLTVRVARRRRWSIDDQLTAGEKVDRGRIAMPAPVHPRQHAHHLERIDVPDHMLAAAVFGHGMAGFGGDGLAEFGEHDGEGERRGSVVGMNGGVTSWSARTPGRSDDDWGPAVGSVEELVAGEFGDGFLRAVIVDQGFTCGGRRDERGDGGIVERT